MQVYSIMDSSLCLTGTAEVPLGGLYMDQIIPEEQLPIKLAGFGHCFRTEAGAAGRLDEVACTQNTFASAAHMSTFPYTTLSCWLPAALSTQHLVA